MIGYRMRDMFVCMGEPSNTTCVSDDFQCDFQHLPGDVGFDDRGEVPKEAYLISHGDRPGDPDIEFDVDSHHGCADDGVHGSTAEPTRAADYVTLPQRFGDHMYVEVQYARLGPLRLVALPGEFSPELVIGVPPDFDEPAAYAKYYRYPERHPLGAEYTFPGMLARGERNAVRAIAKRR